MTADLPPEVDLAVHVVVWVVLAVAVVRGVLGLARARGAAAVQWRAAGIVCACAALLSTVYGLMSGQVLLVIVGIIAFIAAVHMVQRSARPG